MSETGEWIEHDGGPCPVASDELVDVKFEDGQSADHFPAHLWSYSDGVPLDWWKHEGTPGTGIIAYRVVKP